MHGNSRDTESRIGTRTHNPAVEGSTDPIHGSGPPRWYDEDADPCDCDVDAETVKRARGYSDSCYFKRRCPDCGHEWCGFIEG